MTAKPCAEAISVLAPFFGETVMKHIQIRNSDMDWHIAANNLG